MNRQDFVKVMATRLPAVCVVASALMGCGGDPATPDECADVPKYDLRNASKDQGAVQDVGTVENSPLTAEQQRQLQILAGKGCITLPHKAFSLKANQVRLDDLGNVPAAAGSPANVHGRDAGP
jgi:hypothetical protein